MNPLHNRRAALILVFVAVACALAAILGDRPMFATTLFPAIWITMLGRSRRCPQSLL